MTASPPPLEEFDARFLDQLIVDGVAESPTLEFKREAYKVGGEGNNEFLKDVTAFANSLGGLLVIGLDEADGQASKITPIEAIDAEGHELRLLSVLRQGVDPPLRGVQLKCIPYGTGHVMLVRVPRSLYPPHQVTAQKNFKIYIRHSTQVSPASMPELRNLFDEVGMGHRQAEEFRVRRLADIEQGRAAISLADRSSQFVLHIQPLSAPRPFEARADLRIALENSGLFRPMGDHSGWTDKFNADGFANTSGAVGRFEAYVQLFRSGQLEAATSGYIMFWKDRRTLAARYLQRWAAQALPTYLAGLERAGVAGPFIVSLSLLGTKEAVVDTDESAGRFHGPAHLTDDKFLLPSILVEEPPASPEAALAILKPALDPLWNAAGFVEWIPERRR